MITFEQALYVLPILALTVSILYNTINLRNANKTQQMQLETRQVQLFMNINAIRGSPEFQKLFHRVTFIDDWKIIPRLMMLAVTVLTYQSVHWYMSLPDPSNGQAGLVSVCMGALTGCFGIWMNGEQKK